MDDFQWPIEVSSMIKNILSLFGKPDFLAILLPFSTFVGVKRGNGFKQPSTSPWYSWCPPFAKIRLLSLSNGHCPPFSLYLPFTRICQSIIWCVLSKQHPTNSFQGASFARRLFLKIYHLVTQTLGGPDQEDHSPTWPVYLTHWLSYITF